MLEYLPNFISPKAWSADTKITYTPGPTGNFNKLNTGSVFEGQYAIWFEQNANLFKLKAISRENEVAYVGMPGGLNSGYFSPSNTLSQDKNRISNVVACFDNQSVLVLGYQDNGDSNIGYENKPYINIGYSGGAKLTGWRGWNPELFNNVQVNYPYNTPSALTGRFLTGLIGCYYTDQNGSNLYVRYQNDNFSTEFLVNSGLTPSQNQRFGYNLSTVTSPYNQFKKVILRKDNKGNIISIASKSNINYAFDDFERMSAPQQTSLFTGGYGPWKPFNVFSAPSGVSYFADIYFYDSLDYNTGNINLLNSGTNFINSLGFKTGQTTGTLFFADIYFYDSLDYNTGDINLLNSGTNFINYLGFKTGQTTGTLFFADIYFYNNFETNLTGFIQNSGYFLSGSIIYNMGLTGLGPLGYIINSG